MSKPIRIVVADDHPVVRDGLIAMLQTQSDFEVIGEAGDGAEALHIVAEQCPRRIIARSGDAAHGRD